MSDDATGRLRVWVQGVGLLGPGLDDWSEAAAAWRMPDSPARPHSHPHPHPHPHLHVARPTLLPVPARLPPAERRRAGAAVKLGLAVADQAVAQAMLDPAGLATVFTSSSGEGTNCHALCETLATPAPMVSPIRFTNSVHNAAAGCWHIAVGSQAASTSLCAFDGSFSAGLLDAAVNVQRSQRPVLLVASDSPYPEPLNGVRPLPDHFGVALVLAPEANDHSLARLEITLVQGPPDDAAVIDTCADAVLEATRRAIPAARSLPLLMALARAAVLTRSRSQAGPQQVEIDYLGDLRLRVAVQAC